MALLGLLGDTRGIGNIMIILYPLDRVEGFSTVFQIPKKGVHAAAIFALGGEIIELGWIAAGGVETGLLLLGVWSAFL